MPRSLAQNRTLARDNTSAASRHDMTAAHVSVLAEGDYRVDVPAAGQPLAQLLNQLGIGERTTQLYVDGHAADAESIVQPGSRVDILPAIRGG